MNKPVKPVKNEVVYLKGSTIIVRNESEEFGVSYYLYHEGMFSALTFGTLESALEHADYLDGKLG